MKHVKLFEMFMESMHTMDSVVDIAAKSPDHKTLVAAVTAADLIETLSGEGPFTIFAPSDDAFAKLPIGKIGAVKDLLKAENKEQLVSLLKNHVVAGNVMSGDLRDGQMVETLGGRKLQVSIEDGEVLIDGSKVTAPNLAASNGVVHFVDSVIIPNSYLTWF
jgi:uncharacterized surface protein with fasciclin (FAS1) repeats